MTGIHTCGFAGVQTVPDKPTPEPCRIWQVPAGAVNGSKGWGRCSSIA